MHTRYITRAAAAALLGATLAACGQQGGREDYVGEADTPVASPGTVLTPNVPNVPDSTTGVSERTGETGPSGDRQAQNSTAAIPNTPEAGREAAKAALATDPMKGKADSGGRKPDKKAPRP